MSALDERALEARHGFFSGIGGINWSLIQVGELTGHEGLIQKGLALLDETRQLKPAPPHLDVISGSAGMIPLYLHLAEKYRRDAFYELALSHGEFLLEQALKSENGWCWDTMGIPRYCFCIVLAQDTTWALSLSGHTHLSLVLS